MDKFVLGIVVGALASLTLLVKIDTYFTPVLHEEDVNDFVDNVQSFLASLDDFGTE